MQNEPSNSAKDDDEPVRFSIPQPPMEEYLLYSEEDGGFIAPGEGSHWDAAAFMRELEELSEKLRRERQVPKENLQVPRSVLDVPPSWRKSLGGQERDLFLDLVEDDENLDKSAPPPTPSSTPSPGRQRRRSPN